MATAPQNSGLPLLYRDLVPLSSVEHADYKVRPTTHASFVLDQHAVPITVEEFPLVQRRMPIVFSAGPDSVPLALMGLNEGVNIFFDAEGKLYDDEMYVPAYIRRYPFLLARLRQDSEELSLCFDPSTDTIGKFDDGEPLFADGQPTEIVKSVLNFAQQFEESGLRTGQFMREIEEMDLLMDGEVSIQPDGAPQPFVYRGFRMIDEKKLADLRGDQLRKMNQTGMLPLVYAHLFSVSQMRELFSRQVRQGKGPQGSALPQTAAANA